MVWYVALVALLNVGMGYLLAMYLERGRKQFAFAEHDAVDEDTL